MRRFARFKFAVGALVVAAATSSGAQTTQTFGGGSAVSQIDRAATFDGLDWTHNGLPLSDYSENFLFVRTSGDSFTGDGPASPPYFNPFHTALDPATQAFYFPFAGTYDWVTIETTDAKKIYGLEFLYGNGWTTGDIYGVPWGNSNAYVLWQTLNAGTVVSSGQVGADPLLQVGTVIGFSDPSGFDSIQLKCMISTSADPNLQALALDDVHVQLSPVPEPASVAALGVGLAVLLRRRKSK